MASKVTHVESPGQTFVWYAQVDSIVETALLAEYKLLLDEEERSRHDALHFDDDRHLYLVAHALLRTSLSRCADVRPEAWAFRQEEFGRPEIAGDGHRSDRIRFNLSHTRGLAACAITRNVDIGIDVECLDRRVDTEAIAPRYFSHIETEQLAELSDAERKIRFLEYWTLKESYVKARGDGLSFPLDSFYFQSDNDGKWQITFVDGHDAPDEWQFACLRPTENHVMSIAIHHADDAAYEISVDEFVPLAAER
jgi:4'-phosphopantetheinyl transferase